ncbi:hypothetical protein K437DRAFT_266502 [Tilletiaria anomala UBC 951]|uniref:Uncharacterized protein n=1 Tax=Tilletiaria anomala (strain ATCC 24038 / CBS 436.72 / UBC 951) TaxID=1037660 RepID=A0A066WNS3_TILAU|nr:uncharacterized protein K437DRAFT_266502 [Tilletiaria anomala UBC 951]KDN52654.1 hypothetical protein K437DRAFT_266502 [Tilletiaria anomala UBC 951]
MAPLTAQGFATKATPVSFYGMDQARQAQSSHPQTPMSIPRPLSAASSHSQYQLPNGVAAMQSPGAQSAGTGRGSTRGLTPQQMPAQAPSQMPIQPLTPGISALGTPSPALLPRLGHRPSTSTAGGAIPSADVRALGSSGGMAEEVARARAERLTLDQQAAAQTMRVAQSAFREGVAMFPPGAAILRVLQMAEAMGAGTDTLHTDFWRDFTEEFYLPNGSMRLILRNSTNGDQRGLEVPNPVLPRWFMTSYHSGVRSVQYTLGNPREYTRESPCSSSGPWYPPPPRMPPSVRVVNLFPSSAVTHIVAADSATLTTTFQNGWQVQMTGTLRISLMPHSRMLVHEAPGQRPKLGFDTQLRFESLDFIGQSHTSYISRAAIQRMPVAHSIPLETVAAIVASHRQTQHQEGKKGSPIGAKVEEGSDQAASGDEKANEDIGGSKPTITIEEPVLPECPVNEYGITLRSMRCLEITESICQLRDLMDLSLQEGIGPLEAMHRFAVQYRELQQTRNSSGAESVQHAQPHSQPQDHQQQPPPLSSSTSESSIGPRIGNGTANGEVNGSGGDMGDDGTASTASQGQGRVQAQSTGPPSAVSSPRVRKASTAVAAGTKRKSTGEDEGGADQAEEEGRRVGGSRVSQSPRQSAKSPAKKQKSGAG